MAAHEAPHTEPQCQLIAGKLKTQIPIAKDPVAIASSLVYFNDVGASSSTPKRTGPRRTVSVSTEDVRRGVREAPYLFGGKGAIRRMSEGVPLF